MAVVRCYGRATLDHQTLQTAPPAPSSRRRAPRLWGANTLSQRVIIQICRRSRVLTPHVDDAEKTERLTVVTLDVRARSLGPNAPLAPPLDREAPRQNPAKSK